MHGVICITYKTCLLCVVSIRFVWEKDSQVIVPQSLPRLRLDINGTLHISQTWSGDIGTYTCRVTSVGGNDSRSAHLRVRSVLKPFSHYPLWFYPCSSSSISSHHYILLSLALSLSVKLCLGFSISLSITSFLFLPVFSVSFSSFLIQYSSYCLLRFFSSHNVYQSVHYLFSVLSGLIFMFLIDNLTFLVYFHFPPLSVKLCMLSFFKSLFPCSLSLPLDPYSLFSEFTAERFSCLLFFLISIV